MPSHECEGRSVEAGLRVLHEQKEPISRNITTPGWIDAEKRKVFWRADKATPSLQESRAMLLRAEPVVGDQELSQAGAGT
jgi:hypothetical protein